MSTAPAVLNLGGITLPLDAITQTFGILAVRGAGKSNTAAAMAEEMFAAGLPFVVVDPVGAWYGLRSAADGKGPGLAIPIFGGEHGDVPLEKTGGALVADLVVAQRLSIILDVSEFSKGDRIRFLTDFAERLYRKNRDPLHLFLEEADDFIPQKPFREEARCLAAWETIVRRGRGRGLGITMITQRSAALNKNVLTQTETLLVLRVTSPQDRKAIAGWVEYHGQAKELLESLSKLGAGEAWVWSPHWLKRTDRVQIRRRTTFDSGATPKDVRGRRRAATLADVDLAAVTAQMAATIERAKADDPKQLRAQLSQAQTAVRTLEAQLAARVPAPVERPVPVSVVTPEMVDRLQAAIERAFDLTRDLQTTSSQLFAEAKAALEQVQRAGAVSATSRIVPPARPIAAPVQPVRHSGPKSPTQPGRATGACTLPKGERVILTAIAQHPDGVTREQLTVLTGYKRSSRDTYLQRLREPGLAELVGDRLLVTDAGVTALGADYDPLPTGDALRDHWMDRLPQGERKVLEVLVAQYPAPVTRPDVDAATGYLRSSRDTYLQRLLARRLITTEGRGAVRASDALFG